MTEIRERTPPALPAPAGHIYYGALALPCYTAKQLLEIRELLDIAISAIEDATGANDPSNYPTEVSA